MLDTILGQVVVHFPQVNVLCFTAAKKRRLAGDVPAAREAFERASFANPGDRLHVLPRPGWIFSCNPHFLTPYIAFSPLLHRPGPNIHPQHSETIYCFAVNVFSHRVPTSNPPAFLHHIWTSRERCRS